MYADDNVFGLTTVEMAYDKVTTFARFQQLVNRADAIISNSRDTNAYGEFRFVTLVYENKEITFYGHGTDHNGNWEFGDTWKFYMSYSVRKNRTDLLNCYVMQELMKEHKQYPHDKRLHQTKRSSLYNMLVNELGDEDAIMSMLEDMGY